MYVYFEFKRVTVHLADTHGNTDKRGADGKTACLTCSEGGVVFNISCWLWAPRVI